ncbi:hypothetical protein WEB32_30185 [Streptomyces netropsis]|uniref:hypothetical protein n=1 Tax=Streptomyces netropsis TaxID=55404 RepID=UPI0030CF4A20
MLIPVVSAAALTAVAPPAGADPDTGVPPMPVARAYQGTTPLESPREVTRACALAGCRFQLQQEDNREYLTAVSSVGNAVINCTNSDILIDRTLAFETSSTDNVGGEISGSTTTEGTISTTGQITFDATKEVSTDSTKDQTSDQSHSQWGANKNEGPTTEDVTKTGTKDSNHIGTKDTAKIGTMNNVALGAKAAFQLAFKATFSHSWTAKQTETTRHQMTVKSGDIVVFGVQNAMVRVQGVLSADKKKMNVKDVTVDSPSTVNSSLLNAQSFTMPNKCLTLRPKGRAAAHAGPVGAKPTETAGLYEIAAPPPWVKPTSTVVVPAISRKVTAH